MRTERYTVAQVLDAIHEMHTCWGAAQRLKCSPCTVRGYAKRHPTVSDALEQETRDLVDLAKLVIREKLAKKDLGAAIFVLKTRAKDEGWTERQEITGADGSPIGIAHSGKVDIGLDDSGLATVAGILLEAGAFTATAAREGADTETDEVHTAQPDAQAAGIPASP